MILDEWPACNGTLSPIAGNGVHLEGSEQIMVCH